MTDSQDSLSVYIIIQKIEGFRRFQKRTIIHLAEFSLQYSVFIIFRLIDKQHMQPFFISEWRYCRTVSFVCIRNQ